MEGLRFPCLQSGAFGSKNDYLCVGDKLATLDRSPFRTPANNLTLGDPHSDSLRRGFSLATAKMLTSRLEVLSRIMFPSCMPRDTDKWDGPALE